MSFHLLHCSCGGIHALDYIVLTPLQIPMADGLPRSNNLPLYSDNTPFDPPKLYNPTLSSSPVAFSEKDSDIEEGFEEGKIVKMKSSESTSKFYFLCKYSFIDIL